MLAIADSTELSRCPKLTISDWTQNVLIVDQILEILGKKIK